MVLILLLMISEMGMAQNIIPQPQTPKELEGTFVFSKNQVVSAPEIFQNEAFVLAEMVEISSGFKLNVQKNSGSV